MQKINLGLVGVFIIIVLMTMFLFYYKKENQKTVDALEIIQIILDDLDRDIHEIKKKIK